MFPVKGHAGTAGVDQLTNSILKASFNNVTSTDSIGSMEEFPRAPDPGYRSGMKNNFLALAGGKNTLETADVSVYRPDIMSRRNVLPTPRHHGDFVALFKQLLNQF